MYKNKLVTNLYYYIVSNFVNILNVLLKQEMFDLNAFTWTQWDDAPSPPFIGVYSVAPEKSIRTRVPFIQTLGENLVLN